ncbi:unnamed protein product [Adineta steineri]|uniref:Uncharacterized protein n=1 Tax=Adineta steineri TaxID=433720 RepID=A0A814E0F7_9BILA|nr:unnamed protein product [Adineta steineri]CAF0959634.1 unnamed protein product [Adineta steineri]
MNEYDTPSGRTVNIEYFNILWPHLKHYNPYCGLCVVTRYFGHDYSQSTSLLLRCVLQCSGRDCKFGCKVFVRNGGECYLITSNSTVYHHIGDPICRPVRGSQREKIMEKFKAGGSVFRVHAEYAEKRTTLEKQGFNYDTTGKSKKVFKKIKAEVVAQSLLAPDVATGIDRLHDQLVFDVKGTTLRGALQIVQSHPFCSIVFTEASIRLYDAIVEHKDSVLSWDATGGVVKNFTSKQILYYELTISHPNIVNEDSLIPLTFMLSESQSLFTITQWLGAFKENHKKIFPHKKDRFPKPAIILSDRAQIFLQAALLIFNEENYRQFLSRAYRIVTKRAHPTDFSKTNIHACLSHFMLDMRKRVNKHLPDEIREFAMWAMALMVNSNTYNEIKENWRLICQVFLNNTTNSNVHFKKYYTILLSRISKITIDSNASKAISNSKDGISDTNDPFEFNDEDDSFDTDEENELHSNKRRKTSRKKKKCSTSHVIDEEKELNEFDSPFKNDLNTIYYECCEESIKINGTPSSTDKISKGSRMWLLFINQRCMPTVAIWSNLLLGNLSRHGQSSVHAFDTLLVSTHDQRTNAISERRMGIVKRTQLGVETRTRVDLVLQILVYDMIRLVETFSVSYMATCSQTDNLQNDRQLVLNEVREKWRQPNHRGHGYYCKPPNELIKNNLKNALIMCPSTINSGLVIPVLPVSNWLNVTLGILLSIKVFRDTLPQSSLTMRSISVEIIHFISNWMLCLNRIKPPKKTSPEQKELLNFKFHLPLNVPSDIDQQIAYILDKILIELLGRPIPVKIIYTCTSCQFITETRSEINYILISMLKNQFHLDDQLSNYFTGNISDYKCTKCHSYMLRHIKIIDCPSVIILKIDHNKDSSTTSCKSPDAICFSQFMDKSSIGCVSSTVFDVVGFLSVCSSADMKEKKLMSVTKIKQRWYVNPLQKLIGNGINFSKSFATSRIIILERVRTCSSNFLYAIAQCCSFTMNIKHDRIEPYKTLRDAIKIIENNEEFSELRRRLLSTSITYYICNKCSSSSDSLSLLYDCIHIYEQNSDNTCVYGMPLLYQELLDSHCSICNEKTKRIVLPIHNQIHVQCPSILMCCLSHTTFNTVINFHVELTDHIRNKHVYKPVSALLVDEYNTLSVIKLKNRSVYCSSPYETSNLVSNDEINELFYTARTVIVFLEHQTDTDMDNAINSNINEHRLPTVSPPHQEINNMNNVINTTSNVLHTPALSSAHQTTTTATSTTPVLLQQPLSVSIFDKTSSKTILGTVRSLTIVKK